MRTLISLLLILVITAISAIYILARHLPITTPVPTIFYSQGPTIERLEGLSQLVTMRVHVADCARW